MRTISNGAVATALAVALAAPGLAVAQEPEPAPPVKDKGATVTYDKGATISSNDGDFQLKIVGRLQARWELFRFDDGDDATDDELEHRFLIARGRVTLQGHAFGDFGYKMQTELGRGFVYLRDFYLDVPLAGSVVVRAGQWKRPYSRHQITSSGNLQLVDRSIADSFSAAGRDIGVALHNRYEKSPEGLEWAIGVFNGTGDRPRISCETETDPVTMETTTTCNNPSNVPSDIGPMVVGRVGWNMGGIKGYSESDLEGGGFRLAAAVSYMGDLAEGDGDFMVHRIGADLIVKVSGLSATGAVFVVNQKPDPAADRETDVGFFVQGGYMLAPRKLEVAARFSLVPDGDENTIEVLGGFNWFLFGHSLKWQTDAGLIRTSGDPSQSELVLRTQAQLIF
jgi:hypothetical protein